jgi:uncharacterized protein (DUF4213/DUF364 family)
MPTGMPKSEIPTREKYRRVQKNTLELTLERLYKLYDNSNIIPGKLIRLAIKPNWIAVLGSNNECGIATNFTGIRASQEDRSENRKILDLVGKTFFEIADLGIHSSNLRERSLGVAALSALSQQFLGCTSIRNRGFLAQCWILGDKFVQQYPTLSRLITKNDIVAVIGYGSEVRNLMGRCRELHVMDSRHPETFKSVIINGGITYGPKNIIIHSEQENEKVLATADVVIITASTLVKDTFEDILRYTTKARLVGLYGPDGSIIPDVFFERGVDFITSYRTVDPVRFSDDMVNDYDMEFSLRSSQKQYMFMRPLAKTRGTPIQDLLR